MFCPRDLPSLEEIRVLTKHLPGVEATSIFTAMRTLEVADALASAVEGYLHRVFGLSTGRFSLLMILHRHVGFEMTPSELAERAAVTRATITGLVDGLVKDGLVARRRPRAGDRRRVALKLTSAGQAFVEKLIPVVGPSLSDVAAQLSERERVQFLRLLEKIQAGIECLRSPNEGVLPA